MNGYECKLNTGKFSETSMIIPHPGNSFHPSFGGTPTNPFSLTFDTPLDPWIRIAMVAVVISPQLLDVVRCNAVVVVVVVLVVGVVVVVEL